ncbi:MAG: B12-binding domain-containing radical SAM protein [Desulfobacteraceae bacterium]|nr:B12-binding domain-containing radical SAM protein [Desulfobacteraceae bacterium]
MKVLLNALPPARIDTPSAALSLLKGFLLHHGIQARVIYWNMLLDRLLPVFERNTNTIHFDLLPYLYWIAERHDDPIAQSKANAVIKAQLPIHDLRNDDSDFLGKTRGLLDSIISDELSGHAHDGPVLFGISCKYEQWIPGIVLASYVKERFPEAKIVLGGLRNRDKAESIMRTCGLFDFAIWGEGEYPLLELCRCLDGRPEDMASVPRLVFRKDGALLSSDTETGRFFDMNSGIFPDYDDYLQYPLPPDRKDIPVIFPLESSRGCTWNACRFCVYGEGYVNRKKDPGALKKEIRHLIDRYGARYFSFMDNDIVANDPARLEAMLDDLIAFKESNNIELFAEVVHKRLTADTLEKFPRAGLGQIHFGYEALSDSLLAKMRKRTNFADNLFMVKFARKYGIKLPSANIICGAIGETDRDILESIDNLHFLRFYCDKTLFYHRLIPLRLAKHSPFYDMTAGEDLARWEENTIFHLMPEKLMEGIDRFSLFDFSTRPNFLWDLFARMNDFYYDHTYGYEISRENDAAVYREFFDGKLLIELAINEPAYFILRTTDSRIMNLNSLVEAVREEFGSEVDETTVRAALDSLRNRHLVYCDEDYGGIVSVIDADCTDGRAGSKPQSCERA